eukprot:g10704.t1
MRQAPQAPQAPAKLQPCYALRGGQAPPCQAPPRARRRDRSSHRVARWMGGGPTTWPMACGPAGSCRFPLAKWKPPRCPARAASGRDDMAQAQPNVYHFKLVLLGDASVGKSCLVVRFAKGEFYEFQEPTIGAAFMTQTVSLNTEEVKYEIWDTAGQERYKSLVPMYYRGASAAVIVYDITSKESFDAAKGWVTELKGTDTLIALAGNKVDLEASRMVEKEAARAYADQMGALFMETSAKSGHNVQELFREIAVRLPKQSKEDEKALLNGCDLIRSGRAAALFPWRCSHAALNDMRHEAIFDALVAPPRRIRQSLVDGSSLAAPTEPVSPLEDFFPSLSHARVGPRRPLAFTESATEKVNQKLCEEGECKESRAHVKVKECAQHSSEEWEKEPHLQKLPEGHWREGDRDCRHVNLPLAMVLSDHGRCLSAAASANSISEECNPLHVACGSLQGCNQKELKDMGALKVPKFVTREADGTLKFTEEYDTQQDRQIWNLTEADVAKMDPEELAAQPPLDEEAAKTDPLNSNMASLPNKDAMPEPFKNDTESGHALTIIQKKQWRRAFWQGVEKAGSTYLQGEMMRADGQSVPTFNYLSANPDKGFDMIKHLRAEDLSDDCNDRWSFVHQGRGYEIKTDCEKAKYLVAENNGDGPVTFHDSPYPGPEGKWNLIFAKAPPPEPPANEEVEPPAATLPKEVPIEVEEEAVKDPETSGAAMEMVNAFRNFCLQIVDQLCIEFEREDILLYRGELARCADLLAFQLGKEKEYHNMLENIAGNSNMLAGKAAEVGQKHGAHDVTKQQMHQLLEEMFAGGKGALADSFGGLDEHRQLAEKHLMSSAELQNQSQAVAKEGTWRDLRRCKALRGLKALVGRPWEGWPCRMGHASTCRMHPRRGVRRNTPRQAVALAWAPCPAAAEGWAARAGNWPERSWAEVPWGTMSGSPLAQRCPLRCRQKPFLRRLEDP